jgi:hypothetical protein
MMRWQLKIWWIFFLLTLQTPLWAETYTLGNKKNFLPFEKSWMAKTDNPQANLLFFDPSFPNPRPIVQVALSAFRYPEDLSAFLERYRREKSAWVTKQSGLLKTEIESTADLKTRLIQFKVHFTVPIGEFLEWSFYQQCDEEVSLSLKMMIPLESQGSMELHWNSLVKSGLCQ